MTVGVRLAAAALLFAACASAPPVPTGGTAPAEGAGAPIASAAGAPVRAVDVPPLECRHGPPLELSLERWLAALRTATGERRNELLAELELADVPAGATLDDATIVPLALASDEERDRLVTLRFASTEEGEADHVRARALLAAGDQRWCKVHPTIEDDQLAGFRACVGVEPNAAPVALRPVHLLDARRHALELTRQYGECRGCGRSGTVELSYWVLRVQDLVQVFQHTLYHATYSGCPFPPVKEQLGSVQLDGRFPKAILAEREIRCRPADPDLPAQYREPCAAEKTVVRHTWLGEAFVAEPKP